MTISVSFQDLVELSGAIGKAEGNVDAVRSDVKTGSGNLAGHWKSQQAAENWQVLQGQWDSACDKLHQALHTFAMKVQSFESDMQQTESKNAQLFAGE
jgi:WXG100 family type VII secretion target